MFWRGGSSPTGYFNRDGWYGRGPLLGQPDTECTGDVCVIIASRLNPTQAKSAYDKMRYAMANRPDCIDQGTAGDVSDRVAAKLERAVLGIEPSAGLTRDEAEYLGRFEACVGIVPPSVTPAPGVAPRPVEAAPVNPLVIGGGVVAAALLVALLS